MMKRLMTLMILVALAGLACGPKSINHVLADPGRYSNKEVQVQGEVVESYSVAGRGAYRIKDDTGELWVVSHRGRGVPRKGARVSVKGRVQDGFELGDLVRLPRGLGSGLVLVESSHKAK